MKTFPSKEMTAAEKAAISIDVLNNICSALSGQKKKFTLAKYHIKIAIRQLKSELEKNG